MKRFIILLICTTILFTTCFAHLIVEASTKNSITDVQAIEVAIAFVNSDKCINTHNGFSDDICISQTEKIYDINDNVCAYLIQFENIKGEDSGYVIVGSSINTPVILEFAYEGTSFLEIANNKIDSTHNRNKSKTSYFYNGGVDYYVEKEINGNTELYQAGNSINRIEADDISFNTTNTSYAGEWENIQETIRKNAGKTSNPPPGSIIESPSNYESGYTSQNVKIVHNALQYTYFTTDQFTGSNNCGPTCGVNFMYYWYNRGYTNLFQLSWTGMHDYFYSQMGTDTDIDNDNEIEYGTNCIYFLNAIKSYLNTYASGYSVANYSSGITNWNRVTSEIDADYPPVILLQKHKVYGDHYVLGLGYREYVYSSGNSQYILIADGHTGTPNRYVHFSLGYYTNGSKDLFAIRPN